jgi:hypothetical protein
MQVLPIIGGMDDRHVLTEGWAAEQGRKRSLWSHDVLFATVLTFMAISLIGVAWMSSAGRNSPPAATAPTAVTQKGAIVSQ